MAGTPSPFIVTTTDFLHVTGLSPNGTDIPEAQGINVRELLFYKISYKMYPITILSLCVLGTLGNSLCLLILSRSRIRSGSSAIVLRALAVSDTCMVLSYFIAIMEKYYVNNLTYVALCKIVVWGQSTFQMVSSYLVILMTVERFTAVTFPMKVGRIFTKKIITAICITVYLILMLINVPVLMYCSTTPRGCGLPQDSYAFFYGKWRNFDSTIAAYIPEIAILILNISIIVQLARATAQQKNLRQEGGARAKKQTEQITAMLLGVSITYWILNTPMAIFTTAAEYMFDHTNPHMYVRAYFMQVICLTLMVANNCINFFIYCLTGKKFRDEFLTMLGCKKDKRNTSKGMASTSTDQVTVSVAT
ncbi:hypothetical protein CAPTEDRAFT_199650 [Capitella teleta]|uniref:G-protein coupled receptors family 1 profile domain-containing protein n=1 Tax=Capitella teleta TaxID=283909 RepID=R7U959_CAPTE|nr:hypothetical protein CAPTEDRAFT_199650 [Capitella teleta]|eukprot:ELU02676.1 hypothetical protein CAPTEDRAFT_199650 [Capitella teleta]